MSNIYDWDLIASNNESSDELINWAEGQRPSSINNSARAMMKRVREYLTDTGGSLQGVVTNNEDEKTTRIQITTKTKYPAYVNDLFLRFQATGKNLGSTSLSVDALLDRPILKTSEQGNTLLSGGEIQEHCIYEIVYRDADLGQGQGYWFLLNPTPIAAPPAREEHLFPAGTIAAFGMQALPRGWLVCDGRAVSRETYKNLLDAIGLTWGIGDGATTFNIPDLRGMFLRGFDAGRGIDRNRAFADRQEGAFKVHRVEGDTGNAEYSGGRSRRDVDEDGLPPNALFWVIDGAVPVRAHKRYRRADFDDIDTNDRAELIAELRRLVQHEHTFVSQFVGGAETRPRNMSVVYGIKT